MVLLASFSPAGEIKLPKDYCSMDRTVKDPFEILLPRRRDLGLCATSLVSYLIQLHNDFINTIAKDSADANRYIVLSSPCSWQILLNKQHSWFSLLFPSYSSTDTLSALLKWLICTWSVMKSKRIWSQSFCPTASIVCRKEERPCRNLTWKKLSSKLSVDSYKGSPKSHCRYVHCDHIFLGKKIKDKPEKGGRGGESERGTSELKKIIVYVHNFVLQKKIQDQTKKTSK